MITRGNLASVKIGPTGIYLCSKNSDKSSLTSDEFGNLIVDTKSFNVGQLTGSTGYFKSLSVDSTGISLGQFAGLSDTSVNIGYKAGQYNQGNGSIAIGYLAGPTSMSKNSIVLNASDTELYGTGPTGGFYVAPIFTDSKIGITGANTILVYGPDKQIIGVTGDALTYLGLGSTKEKSNDVFIRNNFIDPPDFIKSVSLVSKSSTDIYIAFDYPMQMNYGFGMLPVISNLNFLITGSNGQTGFTGMTSPQIIKTASTSSVVQCIDISKTKSMGETSVNNNKICYTIPYKESGDFEVTIWYGNGNSLSNKTRMTVTGGYMSSGIPSAPSNERLPSTQTYNSIAFKFKGSSQIDVNDQTTSSNLRFKVFYTPVENVYRFGGAVGAMETYTGTLTGGQILPYTNGYFNAGNSTGLNYSGNITGIYPDTKYDIEVDASNTVSLGFAPLNFQVQTIPAPAPLFVSSGSNSVTLSGLISGKSVSGGTVSNILPYTTTPSFTQNFPIHNLTDSRGATGTTPLVTFTSSMAGPAGTITGPSASYTGFGSYVYGTSLANNINMTLSTPTDVTGLAGYNGYYLRGNVTTTMTTDLTNGLAASVTQYALSVMGTYSSSNSAVSTNYYAPFYYDGQQVTPVINGTPVLTIVNGNTGMVCGVPVSKGPIVLGLVTSVSGLGTNFYNTGSILSYTPSNGTLSPSSETDLSKLTSGSISNGTFTNNSLSLSILNYIKLTGGASLKITTTATNLYGTSIVGVLSNGVNILYDQASFTLANTTFTSATAILNAYSTSCYRLRSTSNPEGCRATPNNTPSNYLYNGLSYSSYASTKFDNTKSIKDDTDYKSDLIISEGLCTSNTIYYIDYSIYGGTNYSSLSSVTRYATFAWKIDTPAISSGTYNFINFKLGNTFSTLFSSNGSVYTSVYPSSHPDSKFLLYYRLEDTANLNSTGVGWTTLTSPWIDGNAFDASGTMYPVPGENTTQTSYILKGLSSAFTANSTTTVFKVKIPNPISNTSVTSSTNLYIYCRVGLNMAYPFSFNNIQAQLV